MNDLTWPLSITIILILSVLIFVLVAPTPTLAKATNAVGNVIQKFVAWIKNLFS